MICRIARLTCCCCGGTHKVEDHNKFCQACCNLPAPSRDANGKLVCNHAPHCVNCANAHPADSKECIFHKKRFNPEWYLGRTTAPDTIQVRRGQTGIPQDDGFTLVASLQPHHDHVSEAHTQLHEERTSDPRRRRAQTPAQAEAGPGPSTTANRGKKSTRGARGGKARATDVRLFQYIMTL